MEFGSFDGVEDDDHSGFGFVEISRIFARHYASFTGIESFDRLN